MIVIKQKRAELELQINSLNETVEKLTKELTTANSLKESYYKSKQELEDELEQLHGLLDGMEGAGGRKTEHEESYYRKDRKAMTRLASWLASKVITAKEL